MIDRSIRKACINSLWVLASALLVLLMLEVCLRYIYVDYDGPMASLAGDNWKKTHWKPRNSLGYKDGSPLQDNLDLANVLVIGDAFTVGEKIDDIRDRFADKLGERLGAGWDVAIAAHSGWGVEAEFRALTLYPAHPHWVILAYYINDIDATMRIAKILPPYQREKPSGILAHSHALNFMYWRMLGIFDDYDANIQQHRKVGYTNARVMAIHKKHLQRIVDYTAKHGQQLVVILFPQLDDVASTAWMTGKIADFFNHESNAAHVTVVDMAQLYKDMSPEELTVNRFDALPSKLAHRMAADALYNAMMSVCRDTPAQPGCAGLVK